MIRVVGVVAALLCLLSAVPAVAANVVPPGWRELSGSGSGDGLSDNANINESIATSARSASTAVGPDGRPVVVYRDNTSSTGQLEILVRKLSANASTWEQLGGPLNVLSSAQVSEPRVKVSASGDIFVAWLQQVPPKFTLYLLMWNGTAWVPLAGSDADGRVTTDDMVPNTIRAFSMALTPDGKPILAFESQTFASFNSSIPDPQAVFQQIYVVQWNGSGWPFLGAGPFDGGGASNALTFKFPVDAPVSFVFHNAVAPSVASSQNGSAIVAFYYTTFFDSGQAPAEYQGNRDDLFVVLWDGVQWVPLGPAVPQPGSDESLGAPGGISATNAFATSLPGPGGIGTSAPPSIALDPTSDLPTVAWGEGTGAGDGLFTTFTWIRVSEFNGTSWNELGPPAVSDFNGTTGNTVPSLDFYDAGVPVVVWTHNPGGINPFPSVYARQFDFNSSSWIEMGQGSASVAGGIGGTGSIGFEPWLAIGPAPDRLPYVGWIEDSGGLTATAQILLRYFDASDAAPSPTITSFTPASGPVGTTVKINGTNLGPESVSTILFNGITEAQAVTASATMITVNVPEGAHSGPISVQGPGGLATSTGIFRLTPLITGFSPAAAGFGQTVTITGLNLRVGSANPTVKFNGVTAALTGGDLGDGIVKAIVPAAATTGPITVTTTDGTGTSPTNFIFLQPPQVTSLAPASGPAGTRVRIFGKGFSGLQAIGYAAFDGGRLNSSIVSATAGGTAVDFVDFEIPEGATTGRLTIFNPLGSFNSSVFNVTPGNIVTTPLDVVAGSDTDVFVSGTNLFASPAGLLPVVRVGATIIPPTSITGPLDVVGPAAPPPVTARSGLRFRVPLNTPSGKVTITTTAGSGTSTTTLNVIQPPKIVSFTPASGPVGTLVTITGTGLNGSALVTFGGNVSAVPTQVTPTSLKVTVPDGALTGTLRVTNPAATGTSTGIFKVPPKIEDFSPASVVAGSPAVVTVNGTNLKTGSTVPVVKVGAATVSLNASSLTQLQFTVPLTAITGKIGVTTADGTGVSTGDLVVIQPPKPTAFTPAAAPVGGNVTIMGTNLAVATTVTFGGNVSAPAFAVSATAVKATVPNGALTGPLRVTNPAGTGTTPGVFKVLPKITGFAPASVVAGSETPVIVNGSNLRAATGAVVVKVGTFVIPPALVATSTATLVNFRVPLGAVTGKISITTVDGSGTSATDLAVQQPPRAVSFAPAAATVGSTIIVNGTNLTGVTTVIFSGGIFTTPTGVSPTATMLKTVVPVGATTGPIGVVNAIGGGTSTAIFKVLPRVTGFTPASVPAGGNTSVVVTGNNLTALTGLPTVRVGAITIPPALVLANSSTSIEFRVPATASTAKISVTTVDGTATSLANLVVIKPPRPTGVTPAAGTIGTEVTISGTGLTGTTHVGFFFGAIDPTFPLQGYVNAQITSVTETAVKAIVPANSASLTQIAIVNSAGATPVPTLFTVLPKITGFAPSSGAAGDVIVVTGSMLGFPLVTFPPQHPFVKVGPFLAEVLASSPTEVRFVIPTAASTARISVQAGTGTATSATDLVVTTLPVPDLVVFNVTAPDLGVRSSPTAVRTLTVAMTVMNRGPKPSPAATVLVGLAPPDGGAARVLGRAPVPVVAPDASANVKAVVPVPFDLPTGLYTAQVVVDPDAALAELFENNNGSFASTPTLIVDSVAGSYPFRANTSFSGCSNPNANGSGVLAGTLNVTQNGQGFTGPVGLTGSQGLTLSGSATLSGQIDAAGQIFSGMVKFSVSGGGLTGAGTIPLTGSFRDGVLDFAFEGDSSTGVICHVVGTAQGLPGPSLKLNFVTTAQPGAFVTGVPTAALSGPLAPTGWRPFLDVDFDPIFPLTPNVQFTGPAGSGLTASPAVSSTTSTYSGDYQGPTVNSPAFPPGGAWTVQYKIPRAFTVPPPQGATRLVFPVPTLTMSRDGFLQRVSWVYRSAGNASVAPPVFIKRVYVMLERTGGGIAVDSGTLAAGTVSFPIVGDIAWDCVSRLVIGYVDDLGNRYENGYPNTGAGCVTGGDEPPFRLEFSFNEGHVVGAQGLIDFPAVPSRYIARFNLASATPPLSVNFDGPEGSGFAGGASFMRTLQPGGARYDSVEEWYDEAAPPPGGLYTVTAPGGQPLGAFMLDDPQSGVRAVLVVPSVTLTGGALTRVDWTYVSVNGSDVGVQPFMTAIELEVHGQAGRLYAATALPDAPFHVLSQNISWDQVTTVALSFRDDLGHVYRSFWSTAPPPGPAVLEVLPEAGSPGTQVTINGSLFTATVPGGATTGFVTVHALGGTSQSPTVFTVTAP